MHIIGFAPSVFSEECVVINTVFPFLQGELELNTLYRVSDMLIVAGWTYHGEVECNVCRRELGANELRIFFADCRSCPSVVDCLGSESADCLRTIDAFALSYRHLPFVFLNQYSIAKYKAKHYPTYRE
jgi:hypothetical protein